MITLENLKFHEMIGMQTKIIKSTNPQFNNIKGRIIDETKSTFVLSTTKGLKKFPKQQNQWEYLLSSWDGNCMEICRLFSRCCVSAK